jgi:hypothetical protein
MMKNYIAYFEFVSGLYESYFFRDFLAENDKDAINQMVSYFLGVAEADAAAYIEKELGIEWSLDDFSTKMDTTFFSDSETEAYKFIWLKRVDFDLQYIGSYVC